MFDIVANLLILVFTKTSIAIFQQLPPGVTIEFQINVVVKLILGTIIYFSLVVIKVSLSTVINSYCGVNIVFISSDVDVFYCYLSCFY